jgi:hypothetical protein
MDLRVIKILNIVPVAEVAVLPNMVPATADIKGNNLRRVEAVHINHIPCSNFICVSDTRILAEIPELEDDQIETVELWASELNSTEVNKLIPGFGEYVTTTSGLKGLIQRFIKLLLSSPDSDAWGSVGGGVLQAFRESVDKEGVEITTAVVLGVSRVRDIMFSYTNAAPEDTLSTLELLDISWNPTTLSLAIQIKLTNAVGDTTTTALGFGNV